MLQNHNIIFFALPHFHGLYTSTSASIAKELAKQNHVLWVENPYTWKDVLLKRKAFLALLIALGFVKGNKTTFTSVSEGSDKKLNLYFVTPFPIFPINFLPQGKLYAFLSKVNHLIVSLSIRKKVKALGWSNYTFINSYNFYFPNLSDYLKPKLKVYHCVDGMMRKYSLRHGKRLEEKLLKKVDLVITTSPQLQREKLKFHHNVHCIPNAADFHHCLKATATDTEIPEQLKKYEGDVIGYIGNIERRINFQLLKEVMERNPQWTLLMIGPTIPTYIPNWFYQIPNIHFVGKIPYAKLPNYLKALKVTIIPYQKDEISSTIFPLKLYEYLAAGKPVVTTDFNPEILEPISDVIHIAQDSESFEYAIAHSLKYDNQQKQARRIALASKNTWQSRGEDFLNLLEKNLI